MSSYILIDLSLSGEIRNTPDSWYMDRSLPALEVSGEGSVSVDIVSSLTIPLFSLATEAIVSASGEIAANIYPLEISAEAIISNYSNANLDVPVLNLSATGEVTIVGGLSVSLPRLTTSSASILAGSGAIYAAIPKYSLAATMVVGVKADADITLPYYSISTAGLLSIEGTITMSIPMYETLLRAASSAYENMALNIKNYGLTNFTNYDFNSFARFNGVHLGAVKTGISKLDATTALDGGKDFEWKLQIPFIDLEGARKKKIKQAWVTCKTDGDLIVSVLYPDGTKYEYERTGYEVTEDGIRVKFGRGINSRYVSVEMKSKDGCSLDMDTISLILDDYGGRR